MDGRFLVHNSHLEDPSRFGELDPQLRRLAKEPYCYRSHLLSELPTQVTGVYTLTGGRQVGKTTLLKQWMAELLSNGVNQKNIAFFSGELIEDQYALFAIVNNQLNEMSAEQIQYLIIDEVTYIRDWDKAIKYVADAGLFENCIVILTGTDSKVIQEARMRFPGRRGKAKQTDFHLYPLSFRETVELKLGTQKHELNYAVLFDEFQNYLMHGGYLTAINDLAKNKRINKSIFDTYSDWIRGDMIKRGKQEHYLREVIRAVVKRYGSQITWNALAKDLSIDHPKTVADYVELLASMDVVYVQSALMEDKLIAAPKKARKLIFTDPFIFHALNSWLNTNDDPFVEQVLPMISDSIWCAKIVEAIVVAHYRRHYATYYIKAEGEVDIAYVDQKRFWPVEIKWTNHLHPKDLKQINKYSNSLILTKSDCSGKIGNIDARPLVSALIEL